MIGPLLYLDSSGRIFAVAQCLELHHDDVSHVLCSNYDVQCAEFTPSVFPVSYIMYPLFTISYPWQRHLYRIQVLYATLTST